MKKVNETYKPHKVELFIKTKVNDNDHGKYSTLGMIGLMKYFLFKGINFHTNQ